MATRESGDGSFAELELDKGSYLDLGPSASDVFAPGEGGYACFRIPSLLGKVGNSPRQLELPREEVVRDGLLSSRRLTGHGQHGRICHDMSHRTADPGLRMESGAAEQAGTIVVEVACGVNTATCEVAADLTLRKLGEVRSRRRRRTEAISQE